MPSDFFGPTREGYTVTMPQPPKRWPLPPPKGQRCDSSVGSGGDSLGQPVIYMCQKLAVETVLSLRPGLASREVWLCEEHVGKYVELGHAYRNPRKYG